MEKVMRIDTPDGEYHTLTESDMNEQFTQEEIQAFKDDDETFFYVTPYTPRQLTHAKKKHADNNYTDKFEEDYDMAPSVYDILKHLYGGK